MPDPKIDEILAEVKFCKAALSDKSPAKLRFDFIGMAFAFAIAEIGLEIADFYRGGFSFFTYPNVLSHLLLSVYIIASSWIGWQMSQSKGSTESVKDPFTISFLILLVDLFLVICYFIIVRNVNKPTKGILSATSLPEIKWSIVIFVTYFFWDILTKLINEDEATRKISITKKEFIAFGKRGYQSLTCIIILWFFVRPMGVDTTIKGVVCTDFTLISVFVLFRGLKSWSKNYSLKYNIPVYIGIPVIVFTLSLLFYHNIL
jgi:hypothetical protein